MISDKPLLYVTSVSVFTMAIYDCVLILGQTYYDFYSVQPSLFENLFFLLFFSPFSGCCPIQTQYTQLPLF